MLKSLIEMFKRKDSGNGFEHYIDKDLEIRAFENRVCCKDFLQAIEDGSDGFKHYPAIYTEDSGEYLIGLIDNKLNYCPWCGEKI